MRPWSIRKDERDAEHFAVFSLGEDRNGAPAQRHPDGETTPARQSRGFAVPWPQLLVADPERRESTATSSLVVLFGAARLRPSSPVPRHPFDERNPAQDRQFRGGRWRPRRRPKRGAIRPPETFARDDRDREPTSTDRQVERPVPREKYEEERREPGHGSLKETKKEKETKKQTNRVRRN